MRLKNREKEEVQKEIEFWLPGYTFFHDNHFIRDIIKETIPNRDVDELTKNIEESRFMLFGDWMRLLSCLNIKTQLHVKWEKLTQKLLQLQSTIKHMEEKEAFNLREINLMKEDIDFMRRNSDTFLNRKNFE